MEDAQALVGESANTRVGLGIAIVTETFPPEINGVAMTVGRLLDGLVRRGHEIQLVPPRQHRGEAYLMRFHNRANCTFVPTRQLCTRLEDDAYHD